MTDKTGMDTGIEEKLIGIIRTNMEKEKEVTLSSNLRDELELDSFGTMMIVAAIEDEFGIAVDESDFEKFNTVADILGILKEKYLR